MNRSSARLRSGPTSTGRWTRRALGLCLILVGLGSFPSAQAQQPQIQPDPEDDALSKILTEDKQAETLKKDRLRPPIELSRSQVMPNDILPYLKANHWSMFGLEMRANHNDYDGSLQSRPVGLARPAERGNLSPRCPVDQGAAGPVDHADPVARPSPRSWGFN